MPNHRLKVAFAILALAAYFAACSRREPAERWQAIPIPTDAEFTGMFFSDSLNGWITGGGYEIPGGLIGFTHDGGLTWRFLSGIGERTAEGFCLHRLHFWDAQRGCVATDHGILLTDDGGESWRRPREPGDDLSGIFDLQFIDDKNGWAVGPARVLRTEDGGEKWRTLQRNTAESGYLSARARPLGRD